MEYSREDELIGLQILNEYKLKKKLGEGSFGTVYTAANIKTGELFAAKLVSIKFS